MINLKKLDDDYEHHIKVGNLRKKLNPDRMKKFLNLSPPIINNSASRDNSM